MAKSKSQMYIRLKPYNPKRGHVLRRYSFSGLRFYEGRWYKVPETLAQDLSELHQRHGDEDSPYAFDVATQGEARAIETKERAKLEEERRKVEGAELVAASEVRASDLRSSDLPKFGDDGDQELGASMNNSKAELTDMAESLGIEVGASMTKREILEALTEAAQD